MTVSMRVISASDGYKYLLKSVAAVDADRDLSTPLTRYYVAAGTPPGFWLGAGLNGLEPTIPAGAAAPRPDEVVTEEQLRRLLGQGRHPTTDQPLGRAYPVYRDGVRGRRAVAGYDYTFSVPKSVSTLWALADADVQERIVAAHHAAVRDVLGLLEREVAATRTGALGTDGAVAQVDVHGVLATAFDRVDSRAGDPQLHTHLVVSNKVQAVHDGRWRALDGRPMHAATVALSEHYNAVLADHLTRALGVGWEQRSRGRDRNPAWEITGIPTELLETFSRRSRDIDAVKEQLIADYVDRHGHQPSTATVIKLRAQATLATRPDKQLRSLADLTRTWRHRAYDVLGEDPTAWTRRLLDRAHTSADDRSAVLIRATSLSEEEVATLATRVLATVGEKRATWRYWNLHAEASRQTMGLRFASTADRDAIVARVADTAEQVSVRLTRGEAASVPSDLHRADGSSVFRPRRSAVFTSRELLAAEDRLVARSRTATGPAVDSTTTSRGLRRGTTLRLGVDQRAAVTAVATSRRMVDVLVGPAGTGKTTAMRALRTIWEARHGSGSVVGLAPSAAAADVLGAELGITAANTAKWLYEHDRGRAALAPGQLVILDEASLAGTYTLDAITGHAEQVGAKVLLVGDPAQLGAVDAGGAFGLLADDRRRTGDLPELADVRRFRHRWEQAGSLGLRDGDTAVIDAYLGHDRIRDGDTDTMTAAVYDAWKHDVDAGRVSLMVAETREAVTDLNQRARADRIAAGAVSSGRERPLADGTHVSVGDLIVTRKNDRHLHAGRRWVRNGDRWQVTHIRADGSVRVRRLRPDGRLGASVVLRAEYAAAGIELGYAATVHRAQGATVDTCHVLVASPSMTREAFYVAMTRGRHANTAYLATDQPDLEPHQHDPTEDPADESDTVRRMLTGILNHPGAETSAHQQLVAEQEQWTSIAQLAAEYETIANHAQKTRWTRALTTAGLTDHRAAQIIESDAYGALATLLRRAEADGHDPEHHLTASVARHRLDDADDPAAILHHRISLATRRRPVTRTAARRVPVRIAGLIPQATGPIADEHRQSLAERRQLIERRATDMLNDAVRKRHPWVRTLGVPPRDPHQHKTWLRESTTVAAYRDRHQITDPDRPLGNEAQRVDANTARAALSRARQIADHDAANPYGYRAPTASVPPGPVGPGL